MGYVIKKLKKINHHIDLYVDEPKNPLLYAAVYLDLLLAIIFLGVNLDEYFQYQFYKKRYAERKNYIVHRKRMEIVHTCNDPTKTDIFDSKIKFNRTFADFVKRDWLDMGTCTKEEFMAFTEKHKTAFIKPNHSFYGLGVGIIKFEGDLDSLYKKLKKDKSLIEQLIEEDEDIASFNPSSVNTLRVVTLITADGKPKVMTANLRMGNGEKAADNFHHDGLASLLDVEKGIVVTTGVDRYLKRYACHPYTGKQIVGYKIQQWPKVVETVKKAAMVVPEVRYVGWDVAIGKNGDIIIVEGNQCADPDVSQIPDQTGKWYLYKDEIKKLK